MQQPTKPDPMTKYYTMGRDDKRQCNDETRRDATAVSDTMASRDDETRKGKQGQDAVGRRNNQSNKAGVMRCTRGHDATSRQDETRQRDDKT
jgi:hypothetical protein